ncbi:MAG: PCRF domain-containing protein [Patescibacteria group bacterium]
MNKVILEIRAGAGGDEAAIFAGNLARMYQRYAAKRDWKFIFVDFNQTSLEGYKTFIAEIEGNGAYESLKQESGVHRIQRIPKTEKSGRVHTSTASVAVMPEVKPEEIQINQSDLEISFFRSSGPGGQNVNKVETAVRILHKPSGIVVASQAGRSQHSNRETAMGMLRAKLYEIKTREELAKTGAVRKELIGTADRAEKIRTYNFPDDRITDHRISKKFHNIEKILDGDLDPIIKAFQP